MLHSRRYSLFSPKIHHGLAVTELAVGLPLLLTVLFGTMEVCSMIRTQQKLKIVAYEAARVGILPGSESANVTYQCDLLIQQYDLKNVTILMTPANPSALQTGDWFEVRLDANTSTNSLTGWTFGAGNFRESMSLRKP